MGLAAADYDRMIRVFIPGYEHILSTIGLGMRRQPSVTPG
jgi:hypothetical protein